LKQDHGSALDWYRKAAAQGDAGAQFHLGEMLSQGEGAPRDCIAAHMWLELAVSRAGGEDRAHYTRALEALARKMSVGEIAEARRRAQEWRPQAFQPSKDQAQK
jgi:uncharacterized protein